MHGSTMLIGKAIPWVLAGAPGLTELVVATWLVLGSIALLRADRKDIPQVTWWLSRWGRR